MARSRTSYRKRRQQRERSFPWAALAVSVVCSIILLVGIVFAVWRSATKTKYDAATLCPVTGPTAIHAILLDDSDPLQPVQIQRLEQQVESVAQSAALNERVDLYVLTATKGAKAIPAVTLCRPASDGNALTENPERIRRAFSAKYLQPLQATLRRIEPTTEGSASPIMESIKAVCVAAFGSLPPTVPVKLTLVSDLIQNSPILNQYKPYNVDTFLKDPRISELLSDCHGATVDVLYVTRSRDTKIQTREHQVFWERFLDKMHATLVRMERI